MCRLASRPCHFTTEEGAALPIVQEAGSAPTAGLEVVGKGKVMLCWESNPCLPARSLVTIVAELCQLHAFNKTKDKGSICTRYNLQCRLPVVVRLVKSRKLEPRAIWVGYRCDSNTGRDRTVYRILVEKTVDLRPFEM